MVGEQQFVTFLQPQHSQISVKVLVVLNADIVRGLAFYEITELGIHLVVHSELLLHTSKNELLSIERILFCITEFHQTEQDKFLLF